MRERKRHALAPLGGDEMQRHAQEGVDRDLDRHGNAAHRTAQHDTLAIEVDPSYPLVGCGIAGREADRKSERVEPHSAARPGRHAPAELPLTPQTALPARPESWCPGFV